MIKILLPISLLVFMIFLTNVFLINEDIILSSFLNMFDNHYAEQMTRNMIEYRLAGYILLPIVLLLKWILVTLCLYTAFFFMNCKCSFEKVWIATVQAEWVFVLVAAIKFLWFYLIQTNFTLEEYQFFYPLSALNLFNPSELDPWWIYPFQLLNVFEMVYWFALAYFLSKEMELDLYKSFEVVIKGYGSGLLLWVLLVFFITVSFSV